MSDNTELQSGINLESRTVEDLADSLPTYFRKDYTSNNYKLYGAVGEEIDEINKSLIDLEKSTMITEAESLQALEKLAKIVNVTPRNNETLEHYRIRVISNFQNITNEATHNDLIEQLSFILDVKKDVLHVFDSKIPGVISIGMPQTAVDNTALSEEEISIIMEKNVAAGYTFEGIITGTFIHITSERLENEEYDESVGYDSLDENGNPKGQGGTYSTLLN